MKNEKKRSGGGHKKKTRICPVCHELKVFDIRSNGRIESEHQ